MPRIEPESSTFIVAAKQNCDQKQKNRTVTVRGRQNADKQNRDRGRTSKHNLDRFQTVGFRFHEMTGICR
jgi:hypothetical protein